MENLPPTLFNRNHKLRAANLQVIFFARFSSCYRRDKNTMAKNSFEIKHFYAIRAKKIRLPDRARVRSATLLLANGYYFWSK
jgi:hypothetical protein